MRRPEQRIIIGNLEAIILSMASRGEMHGYQVILNIRKEHNVLMGASTIYPLLKEMQRKGLLTSIWDFAGSRPRKLYKITEKGKTALISMAVELQAISSEVAKVLYIRKDNTGS